LVSKVMFKFSSILTKIQILFWQILKNIKTLSKINKIRYYETPEDTF